jgi:molybdate transport system permease protein
LGPLLEALGITLPFTAAAVVVAQTFVAAPLFVRAARLGFVSIAPELEEAAHVEGTTPWQLFRFIMLPLAGRALLSGAVLSWARAIGEFGATIFFAGNLAGITQTMPLAIFLGLEQNLNVALVLSAVLVLVSIGLLAVLRYLESKS